MLRPFLLVLLSTSVNASWRLIQAPRDPDETRDAIEIIKSRGFQAETHSVTTADGYQLTLHRINYPFQTKGVRRPILLYHGFADSSDGWIINSPGYLNKRGQYIEPCMNMNTTLNLNGKKVPIGSTLGFVLAQFNYDVWLANARGNYYSRNHTSLKRTDLQYWEFTIDQMVEYDLPAVISYILKNSKSSQLSYIGHSQGAQILFGLLSSQPKYSKYIDKFIAMAPITFLNNVTFPVPTVLRTPLVNLRTVFRPRQKDPIGIGGFLCRNLVFRYLCAMPKLIRNEFNSRQMNLSRTAVYQAHDPSGTSTWNAAHLMQLIETKRFAKFDYGREVNLRKYGKESPPDYPLERINHRKIALIYSDGDKVATIPIMKQLKSHLKVRLIDDYLVPVKGWTHFDFLEAVQANKYINKRILRLLRLKNKRRGK